MILCVCERESACARTCMYVYVSLFSIGWVGVLVVVFFFFRSSCYLV